MVRKFSSGGAAHSSYFEDAEPIEFQIDEDEFIAYPPKTAQFALFMASQGKTRDMADNVAGAVDFLDGLLVKADQDKLRSRLLDRDDPLEFGILEDIVEMLMEEWMERPTPAASDFSASPQPTARKSSGKPRSRA